MSVDFYLARRYLFNHRPGAWGWMIGWLATGSVALGVAALIITLSVMSGFREDIRKKILGIQPNIVLTPITGKMPWPSLKLEAQLQQHRNIEHWSPFVSGQILIGRGGQSSGAMLKGVDPLREPHVVQLEHRLVGAQWNDLSLTGPHDPPKIFLGVELARNLGAKVGDRLWVVTPGSINIASFAIPKATLFVCQGMIQSGLYDYDSSLAYTDLPAAQKLFDMTGQIGGIGMKGSNPDRSEILAKNLQRDLEGAFWIRSWISLNRNLFSALKLEKIVMFIILILVTLVASVMIVSNLLLNITQKTKEIGILRAIGANGKLIRNVFMYQGLLMGFIGTFLGSGVGIVIATILSRTNLIHLPADVYYIDHVPIKIDALDVAIVIVSALLIVIVATFIPAERATQVDPLEAIRYGS